MFKIRYSESPKQPHCKNEIVILSKYLVTTVASQSNSMNAVGANSRLTFTILPENVLQVTHSLN